MAESPKAPKTPAEAFAEYARAMRDPESGTGPRIRREGTASNDPPAVANKYPEGSPAAEFERYLQRVEKTLPERYTRKHYARPFHPYRDGPAIGLTIVGLGLIAYWLAGLLGVR